MFRSSRRNALLLTLALVALLWAAAAANSDSGTSTTKTDTTTPSDKPVTTTTPTTTVAPDSPATPPATDDHGGGATEPTATPPDAGTTVEHPQPELGHSVGVDDHEGPVRVQTPGSSSWHAVAPLATVPVGSVVDATHGHVTLRTAVDTEGTTQTATFWGAAFQLRQAPGGVTELVLRGARPNCARPGSAVTAASTSHGLWGHDNHGRFRTRGHNSVATVRGTTWFVAERCGGTYTRVTSGSVRVWDIRTHRTVVLHAGESHLARNGD